ncbi:helix-turn-helix transcriptional regulator [Oscillibacter hominis]|uniref:Helix-turn-helix transcriptional regulator n=2 Tax=Oscillibacter hominis TaxID=2763056 RepID=A0A7G9B6H2_9FIRM|nr:helix-turn-helix transcriptional regulator [Oscillibacter hominis]
MAVCYNKLWKLLIDRGLNKTQLCKEANITTNAMARLGRNEDVRVDVLVKICTVLNCTVDDILEIIPESDLQKRGSQG